MTAVLTLAPIQPQIRVVGLRAEAIRLIGARINAHNYAPIKTQLREKSRSLTVAGGMGRENPVRI